MNIPFSPLPWSVHEIVSKGREPVTYVCIIGADGNEVLGWFGKTKGEIKALNIKARFLIDVVSNHCSEQTSFIR